MEKELGKSNIKKKENEEKNDGKMYSPFAFVAMSISLRLAGCKPIGMRTFLSNETKSSHKKEERTDKNIE